MKIVLTPREQSLVEILLESSNSVQVQVRFAGGWVRDKLLGIESNDIDIAVNAMTGEAFAKHLHAFMENKGIKMSNVATIQLNPDKSKHLETATARIFDLDLDFTNLRTETYNNQNRHPQIEFGTPKEDAMRRDITINSLFFNIHSNSVEDWTGHGIADLQNGIIRTPLEPFQTFMDDPLRILRVIRFATRLNYELVPEILLTAQKAEIKEMFKVKISRERVGIEIEKMLSGADPLRALSIIIDIGWFEPVFQVDADLNLCRENIKQLSLMLETEYWKTRVSKKDKFHLYLACALAQFRNQTILVKNKQFPLIKYIVMNALKLGNLESDTCFALLHKADELGLLMNNSPDRKKIGLLIRELGQRPLKEKWELAVLVASVLYPSIDFMNFFQLVQTYELSKAYQLKHLFNGKQLAQILGIKPGPKLGKYLQYIIEWQLENPNGSKQECEQWIKTLRDD